MRKTLVGAAQEFGATWRFFILVVAEATGLLRLMDWLERKLRRLR